MVDLEAAGRELRERHDVPLATMDELKRRVGQRRRRRRVWQLSAALLVVLGVGAIGARGPGSGDETSIATEGGAAPSPEPLLVPELVGIDYVEAQQRAAAAGIAAPGSRVLLALDLDSGAPLGVVTRTEPLAGALLVDGALTIWVAATRQDLGVGALPGPGLAASNVTSPPVGLIVGVVDLYEMAEDRGECASGGPEMRPVRFIRGELVGCWDRGFIWLDHFRDTDSEGGG